MNLVSKSTYYRSYGRVPIRWFRCKFEGASELIKYVDVENFRIPEQTIPLELEGNVFQNCQSDGALLTVNKVAKDMGNIRINRNYFLNNDCGSSEIAQASRRSMIAVNYWSSTVETPLQV